MKARVISVLNKRLWPSTQNTPLPNPLNPNDIVEIIAEVEGEPVTPTNNKWYKTDKGFFVWSGGVSKFNDYNERVIQIPPKYRNTKGRGVKVAILDSGIFHEHQSFTAAIKDVDNSSGSSAGIVDKLRHGTHCAGIIGARNEKNNGEFISGVAPFSEFFISKVVTDKGNFFANNVIKGLEWAIKKQVNIVNMSFALNSNDDHLSGVMQKAHDQGVILIASAGENEILSLSSNNGYFPASHPNSISVGAVDAKFLIGNSLISKDINFVTPYTNISSCDTVQGGFYPNRGSSMSAALLTGIVALIIAEEKRISRETLINMLNSFALNLGDFDENDPFQLIKPH